MEIVPDVNWWCGATRFRVGYDHATADWNTRMRAIQTVLAIGPAAGVRLHTGPHVLENIVEALSAPDVSARSVTRPAWHPWDISMFLDMVHQAVAASGGRDDVEAVAHHRANEVNRDNRFPDGEDYQVLYLAVAAGATVLATGDGDLLALRRHGMVDVWPSAELDDEIAACYARHRRQQETA